MLQEEKDAEATVGDAEAKAEAIIKDARAVAAELLKTAKSDDAFLKELSARHGDEVEEMRARVLAECEEKAATTEALCKKNLESSIGLILASVLVRVTSAEGLRQEIRKAAEGKAGSTLAEAKVKADAILADARGEAKKVAERRAGEATKLLDQQQASEAAKARMDCTRKVLEIRSRYVDEAFRTAEQRIMELPSKDQRLYRVVLARLISEAVQGLEGVEPVAVVRPQDRAMAESILKDVGGQGKKFTLAPEPLNAKGGVILRSKDGKVFFVNTFESRFLGSKDDVRGQVEAALLKED